ncbi:MAG: VTT domain-containing protein [Phycisphaerae bacterium]
MTAGPPPASCPTPPPPSLLHRLGAFGPLAALSFILPSCGGLVLLGFLPTVATYLRSHPTWGLPAYVAGFALLAGLAVLPTYALGLLGGYTFGLAWGFPAALLGYTGAAVIGYLVGRGSAGERVVTILREHPKWDAVYHALLTGRSWHVIWLIALVRIPPHPFASVNLLLAAARVSLLRYGVGSLLGMAPHALFLTWAASDAAQLDLQHPADWRIVLAAIVTMSLTATVITHVARRALRQMTTKKTANLV